MELYDIPFGNYINTGLAVYDINGNEATDETGEVSGVYGKIKECGIGNLEEGASMSDIVTKLNEVLVWGGAKGNWQGLKLTAVEDTGATVSLNSEGGHDWVYEVSMDGGISWSEYAVGTLITMAKGISSCWRVKEVGTEKTLDSYCYFTINNGKVSASGNCMSMIDATMQSTTMVPFGFHHLFGKWDESTCPDLVSAPDLPAITLADNCYLYMFYGCTGLTTAPELPATTLANHCYSSTFRGCTSLTTAPALPAMTLDQDCYSFMFSGCESLTTAPTLPATTLTPYCYGSMFEDCKGLTVAPALPATMMAANCYYYMFSGCENLTTAPELPATTLANDCYGSMFSGCESLTVAPALPVTNLADGCYQYMFYGCESLTAAPTLPATNLAHSCYYSMFSGCSALNAIEVAFTEWREDISATDNWVSGVASTGTFKCPISLPETYNQSHIPTDWEVSKPEVFKGLKLTAVEDVGATVTLNRVGNHNWTYEVSTNDGDTWSDYTLGEGIQLSKDEASCWRVKDGVGYDKSVISYCNFSFDRGLVAASGNCMSMIDATMQSTTMVPFGFSYMFYGCEGLTTAPTLPATTLASNCYYSTFMGCIGLTTAPTLPATTLADGCYTSMFLGCEGLTTAPTLPATTLARSCYISMFEGCKGLTTAPTLSATTLEPYCYACMFSRCEGLTTAPTLPATTLVQYCYMEMFAGCNSLVAIEVAFTEWREDISATDNWVSGVASTGTFKCPTTLPETYNQSHIPTDWEVSKPEVFKGLKLTSIGEEGATIGIKNAESNQTEYEVSMDDGVTWNIYSHALYIEKGQYLLWRIKNTTKAESTSIYTQFEIDGIVSASGNVMSMVDPTMESTVAPAYGFYKMFEGCTGLTTAPELPATTLSEHCYESMFEGCTKLTNAPELPAKTLAPSCYDSMFKGCINMVSSPTLAATILSEGCYKGMFLGCTHLVTLPKLSATILEKCCYKGMFQNCKNIKIPEMEINTVAESCCESMFENVQFSDTYNGQIKLNADILHLKCYASMFKNSTIDKCPTLNSLTLADECYADMFSNSSITAACDLPAISLTQGCYKYMFANTNIENPPNIEAETVAKYSCYHMFENCVNLKQSPVLYAEKGELDCYSYMFKGCTSLTEIRTNLSAFGYETAKVWVGTNYRLVQVGTTSTRYWTEGISTEGTLYCDNNFQITLSIYENDPEVKSVFYKNYAMHVHPLTWKQKYETSTKPTAKATIPKALVIGMEYSTKYGSCSGCELDAHNMDELFKGLGIQTEKLISQQANKAIVLEKLDTLVTNEGLSIFYYSGHGGGTTDISGDEEDGQDEFLCLNDAGLLDDELWEHLAKAKGRVLLIFDCCHSQTMFRSISPSEILKSKFCKGTFKRDTHDEPSGKSIMCWSGCPDNTVSYGNADGGFFTNAILRHFNKDKTYNEIWELLESDMELKSYESVQRTDIGTSFGNNKIFT